MGKGGRNSGGGALEAGTLSLLVNVFQTYSSGLGLGSGIVATNFYGHIDVAQTKLCGLDMLEDICIFKPFQLVISRRVGQD